MKIYIVYKQKISDYSCDEIDMIAAFKDKKLADKKVKELESQLTNFSTYYWISEPIDIELE